MKNQQIKRVKKIRESKQELPTTFSIAVEAVALVVNFQTPKTRANEQKRNMKVGES